MSLSDYVFDEIEATSKEHPHRFLQNMIYIIKLALIAIRFLEGKKLYTPRHETGLLLVVFTLNIHPSGVT
jgi:hypothetical protein